MTVKEVQELLDWLDIPASHYSFVEGHIIDRLRLYSVGGIWVVSSSFSGWNQWATEQEACEHFLQLILDHAFGIGKAQETIARIMGVSQRYLEMVEQAFVPKPPRHESIWERVRTHPPKCLREFETRTNTPAVKALRSWRISFYQNQLTQDYIQQLLSGMADDWICYELVPPSSDRVPRLFGHYLGWDWPTGGSFAGRILVSPLAIRWEPEPTGERIELFDGNQHGYNGEHGLGSSHATGNPHQEEFRWPFDTACADPVFVVSLGYNFEEGLLLTDKETLRPEDFFESFSLAVWDRSTGAIYPITDFECA